MFKKISACAPVNGKDPNPKHHALEEFQASSTENFVGTEITYFGGWNFVLLWSLVLGIWCFLAGCQTAAPLPPLDFKESGWKIQQGQAVWKPNRNTPELAGEILIAKNSDGRTAVQFTKTPFPFVIAQTTPTTWQLEIPAKNKRYSGHGKPPGRAGWLFLAKAIEGTAPPEPWVFQKDNNDSNWRLENRKSGEVIEGFINP